MISYLEGMVKHVEEGKVMLVVGGVGYLIHTLPDLELNSWDFFYTYLHVREDSLTLYGFSTQAEVSDFTSLLRVKGIGPSLALTLTPHYDLVLKKDKEKLKEIKGIGPKLLATLID